MGKRWRLILCIWGISLLVGLTIQSIRANQRLHPVHHGRYFWWGAARLDPDPLNKHPLQMNTVRPCPENPNDCVEWDPEYIWVEPGIMERCLVFSALPAFIGGFAIVRGLGRLGVSEVATFMVVMPLFIALWFYSVGWLLDRRGHRRRAQLARTSS